MAIVFLEGFDHYTNFGSQYHGKWAQLSGAFTLTTGRKSIGYAVTPTDWMEHALRATTQKLIVGFAVYMTSLRGDLLQLGKQEDWGLSDMGTLFCESDGTLCFGDSTTSIRLASTDTIVANRWHYVELEVYQASLTTRVDASNYAKIYIDGLLAGTATGIAIGSSALTTNYAIAKLRFKSQYGQATFDDIYVMDGDTGGATAQLGDRKVLYAPVSGDVSVQFTPSEGSLNYAMVDDPGPDEDATYNSSGTVGAKDVLSKDTLDMDASATIDAMQVSVRAKKTDIGTRTVTPLAQSSGDETTHDDQALALDYRYRYTVFEQDPHAAAAWTPTTVNAANVGYEAD